MSETSNNGKTLWSLFSGLDDVEVSQVYFNNEKPSLKNGFYYTFNDAIIFRNILSTTKSGPKKIQAVSADNNVSVIGKFRIPEWFRRAKILRELLWFISPSKQRLFNKFVENNRPDIIFFMAGNGIFAHKLVKNLEVSYKVKLITYFTDDYYVNAYSNISNILTAGAVKKAIRTTILNSLKVFGIGEEMCQVYSKLFGKEFIPIMNSVELSNSSVVNLDNVPKRIAYIGGLHLERDLMLERFAKILSRYNSQFNDDWEFVVFTKSNPKTRLIKSINELRFRFGGSLDNQGVQREIDAARCLLHVESDNKKYVSKTKFSVSTKIPEYLNSNSIVIGYGPKNVASMRVIESSRGGVLLDSSLSDIELIKLLRNCLNNDKYFLELVKNGKRYAETYHSRAAVTEKFHKILKEC